MSSYQEQTSGSLPEWNKNVMDLLGQAQAQAGKAYTPYTGQLVAGNTPGMNAAFAQAQQSQGNWKPELDKSAQLLQQGATNQYYGQGANLFNKAANTQIQGLGQPLYDQSLSALQGAMGTDLYGAGQPLYDQASSLFSGAGQFDQNELQKYLNPYLGGVVGEIGRLGNEQFQNQVLPGLTGAFSGLGQHGSARQAMMMSDAAARNQREVLGQQATALNTGYTNAMGDYLNWARQQQSSAQGLAGIGQQQYNQLLGQANLGLQGAGQLFGMGQQQYNQGLGQAQLSMGAAQGLSDVARNQQSGLLQAGSALGNVAQARQQLAIGDYGQLLNAGQLQQQQKQKELDAKYATWQQEQQYPWQQLGNWADLLGKAGTPQSSTSWQAAFKKGGLARYADGGDFRSWDRINFDTKYDQPARDELRLQLLMQELEGNPDDVDLLNEIQAMGVPLEEVSVMPSRAQDAVPERRALVATRGLPSFASEVDAAVTPSPMVAGYGDLARRSFDERIAAYERLRNDPAMAPIGERSLMERAARGLFAASAAEGPAHWGTLLGRAGATFYGEEDARQRTNRDLAVARAGLEDKILPDIGRGGGLGSAAMPGYVSVTGQNGRRFMVNRLDPNDRIEIGTGVNMGALNDAADRYAREQNKDAIFKDDQERAAAYEAHKRRYIDQYLRSRGQEPGGSMFPNVPGRTTPAGGGEDGKVILNPAEKAQQEKIGAAEGEEYAGIVQSGAASRGQLSTLDFLEGNFDKITTGKLTPAMTEIKSWANAFGLDFEDDIAPAQAIKAISGQLALTLRNPSGGAGMPGALSDRDLQFLQSMVPQLGNDDKSNRLILDYARRIAKRNIEVSRRARKYVSNNPRKVLDEGFYDELEEWSSANPLFKEADAPVETDDSRKAAASAGGRQRIKVTPEMLRGQ